jgi:hypothetical protein
MLPTFHQWLRETSDRSPLYTPDQQLVPTIAAYPHGLTRRELRQRFPTLDHKVFRGLLDAYVSIGQLSATQEGDTVRFRARTGMTL